MVAAGGRTGSAAALGAALFILGAGVAQSQGACVVVSAGPAYGQNWAERRQEMLTRNAASKPGSTMLRYAPAAQSCGGVLAQSAEVRYRIALIAPTWQRYGRLIAAAATRHGVPAELILAAIVEESGGRAHAVAEYPGYVSDAATPHKVSLGLGQMLLSTAQKLAPRQRIGRAQLQDPAIAIDLVARYLARLYPMTGFDPRLAGPSYNAGSVRMPRAGKRWSPPNPRYVQRFTAVFDAAVAHLAAREDRPPVSFAALLGLR
jgi:soluble lytic murein transglycosylase-like protein